ncbi:MAG: MBL fold metallo-hydrolase [Acidobacteria bacterium]|nr:MBL fold metallo-hydrolase [Acidobacteriota bacterium]
MKIIPISIPTPFYVGDVNVYLIKEEPLTLIDTGPKTKAAVDALRSGLRKHDVEFADIRRIVLTHAHEDHCGLAKQVRDEARNADIFVHGWETGHLFGRLAKDDHQRIMDQAGVPKEVFEEMRSAYSEISLLTDSLAETEFLGLEDGMELEFETGSLEVLHTPGHTPGSCSFVRKADRTLICGDCVLKRITPNPVISPDPIDRRERFRSLGEYLVSLAKIRAESPTVLYGGHGEPVYDFEEIFNRYVRSIDERQKAVIGIVDTNGVSAWDVAQNLFPDAVDQDVHRFLAISEAIAHLDYAAENGKISRELDQGVELYRS